MTTVKKFLKESEFLQSLHGPFFPSDIRKGENISARIDFVDRSDSINVQVWRLSPLGVELLLDDLSSVAQGDKVNVTLNLGNQSPQFTGLVVDIITSQEQFNIIGIRLVSENQGQRTDLRERRQRKRWQTSNQFLPTGMAPNPAKFNDFIFFRVKDISSDGMQIVTSLRNKFLLTGMEFDSSISFPMISQVRASFRIKNIRILQENNQEFLSLGVTFMEKSTDLMDSIGQYLSQFSDIPSLDELHSQGLSPSTLKKTVQFSYVKSEEDYKDVLRLRLLANKKEGKVPDTHTAEQMGDIFDTRSRIVIAKVNNEVVATGRMTFCEYDQPFETESYLQWDQKLPRREDSVEIMRVCTHPNYRGTDLLVLMFKFMAKAAAQSKRNWIVLGTTDKYLGMYKKMGGKPTGRYYVNPLFEGFKDQLVIGNIQESLMGKGMNPIYWNYVYGDILSYLSSSSLLNMRPIDRLRITLYRALAPLSNLLVQHYVIPKKIEKARLEIYKGKRP
jgi:predicted GNAT family N-acyltransferase